MFQHKLLEFLLFCDILEDLQNSLLSFVHQSYMTDLEYFSTEDTRSLNSLGFTKGNSFPERAITALLFIVFISIPATRIGHIGTNHVLHDFAHKENFSFFVDDIHTERHRLNQQFIELTEQSVQAAEAMVKAARAFFKDVNAVKDHLHKVYFYEKEADRLGNNLKRLAFQMNIDLSRKFHLRYFVLNIQNVSDQAEGVADRLTIYTIKRTI